MRLSSAPRGLPLLSLGLVLVGWVALRVAIWEAPFERLTAPLAAAAPAITPVAVPAVSSEPAASPSADAPDLPANWLRAPLPQKIERPRFDAIETRRPAARGPLARGAMRSSDRLVAEAMLLVAGYQAGSSTSDPRFQHRVGPVAPGVIYAPESVRGFDGETKSRRWSFDLWALWRDDTTSSLSPGRPSYGRSQVGAVLRYHLDRASGHAPQLHLRATRALQGGNETDLAAGVSARPLPGIPVRVAAEARVSDTDAGTELRGAAYAVSEIPPVGLPAGLTGEAYVQGGYVTGEFATPFVDGQARITRELAGDADFRLTAGGAAWGGAQQDAQRVDIGPSAGLSFRLGEAHGRLSADYRFRVAGDAEPASGPALTLTAGF